MRPAGRAAHAVAALALGIGSAGIAPGAAWADSTAPGPQETVVFAAEDLGGDLVSASLDAGRQAGSAQPAEHHGASSHRSPRFVATGAETVYYTESGPHGGVYAATDGGRTRIAALPRATGVGLGDGTLYAVTRGGVLHAFPGATAPGTATRLAVPATANIQGLAVDGGTVYLADWADRTVYAAHPGAPDVRVVVGPESGLERPVDVVADDGTLYVTELGVHGGRIGRLSRIGPAGRTTLAGGLDIPTGLALAGGTLYVAEGGADAISAVDADTGALRPVVTAGLDGPWGIAVRAPAADDRPEPGLLERLAHSVGLVR